MPLHNYVLAAWLTLFGRSRMSLDGFQCLVSALASIGNWEGTRKKTGSIVYPLMVSLALAAFLVARGSVSKRLAWLFWLWDYRFIGMQEWFAGQ
jgi:hypothetical protein